MHLRISAIVAVAAIVCLIGATAAAAAGMSVHTETTIRAAHYFHYDAYPQYRALIAAHPDAHQAGSPFPDWGYATGYHDASEDAHWQPFMETFAAYIHETYPQPWDEETERLVAFFCGLISHNSADLDWHGLGGADEGTIDVISGQETHGDWSVAHTIADTGGDFVESYERDMDWLVFNWYFPLEDIAAVYERYGYAPGEITPEAMLPGTRLLFIGALGNKIGGWLLFPWCASDSTFLVEQLNDYFMGGLDGMAIRVMRQWRHYIDLIEEGAPPVASGPFPVAHEDAQWDEIQFGLWLVDTGLVQIDTERTPRGVRYVAHVPTWLVPSSDDVSKELPPAPDARFFSDAAYRYVGQSFATGDFDGDGQTDLALGTHGEGEPGQPQRGSVHVFFHREDWSGQIDIADADVTLPGDESAARFGWALATVDLNADGVDDLAVGAPGAGAASVDYFGSVVVYYGGPGFGAAPDVTLAGVATYTHLGHVLAGGDLDGDGFADLAVGSPYARAGGTQRGLAVVLLSDRDQPLAPQMTIDQVDWRVDGTADFDWLGYALTVVERKLLVGAVGADQEDAQAVGTLYGYDFAAGLPESPAFTLHGENQFDKFGAALAAGRFYGDDTVGLAIAAPTRTNDAATHAGTVYLLQLDWLAGEQWVGGFAGARALRGDAKWARLGWQLAAGDVDADGADDLLITQPWQKTRAGRVSGAAYLFAGGADILVGATVADAVWSVDGDSDQAMLGHAALLADLGDNAHADVLLGTYRDSQFARHSGTARLHLSLPVGDDDDDDDDDDNDDNDNDDDDNDDDDNDNDDDDDDNDDDDNNDDDDSGCGC